MTLMKTDDTDGEKRGKREKRNHNLPFSSSMSSVFICVIRGSLPAFFSALRARTVREPCPQYYDSPFFPFVLFSSLRVLRVLFYFFAIALVYIPSAFLLEFLID
jgi:hypothetical protein